MSKTPGTKHWILLALFFWSAPALAQVQEKPLSWEDCVREAGFRNPDILAAEHSTQTAKSLVNATRSDYFPSLNGQAGYEISNSANNSSFNPDAPIDVDTGARQQFQVGVTANENLFTGFQTVASVQKSKAQYADALANLRVVKSQISADLKTAFARLLFFQKQVDVAKKIVERREGNVRFIQLRFEGGRENKGSLMRNEALYEQAKFDLGETQRSLRVARRELAKVLGRDYAQNFETITVQGSFDTHFPTTTPDFYALTANNPQHERSAAQLDAAKADVRFAKGDLYPSLDASASLTRRKFQDGNSNTLWSAGVNLNYPLFTGGRDVYEIHASRSEQNRALEALHSGDNNLALGLKASYNDFRDAIENIRVQQGFLSSAQVRAEIARSQYANGLLSYQDWDTIENDLINNERTILESLRDALIAEAAWEKAQGTGAIP